MQIGRSCNTKPEMDGQYYNLWSTDNDKTVPNDDVVIKSVYDPSPVGYSLPASNAFTGFTTTGQQVGNWTIPATSEQVNAKFPFDKGWYFYTKPRKTGNTSFFYASGFRNHNSGRFNDLSSVGGCWVAGPYHAEFGHSLYLGSRSIVHPINYFYNSFGWSVRSAEEKKWRYVVEICNVLTSATLHPPHARRGSPPFMMSWMTQSHIATPYNTQKD